MAGLSHIVEGASSPTEQVRALMERAAADPKAAREEIRAMPSPDDTRQHALNALEYLIPARFARATFDGFRPFTESQRAALAKAKEWVDRALNGKPAMLALVGDTGTGKSHLLYAAARLMLNAGHLCYVRPWYKLADDLRYGAMSPFPPHAFMESYQVREQIFAKRVVFLDEVRPTAGTQFDDTELAKFACHAYDANLAVFVTTNVNPLADVMGPPAASRFTQVIIEGPDHRQRR